MSPWLTFLNKSSSYDDLFKRRYEARSIYAYPSLHGHDVFGIIIHSKYFAVSDWLQSPG